MGLCTNCRIEPTGWTSNAVVDAMVDSTGVIIFCRYGYLSVLSRVMVAIKKYQFTKLFWGSFIGAYGFLLLAMFAIATLPDNVFDTWDEIHVRTAMKLTYLRFSIVIFALLGYPIILFTSVRNAKFVTIALTAWALAIYIDDYLVLYRIIEYPQRGLVNFIQAIRPLFLACLIWMSFELTFRPPEGD